MIFHVEFLKRLSDESNFIKVTFDAGQKAVIALEDHFRFHSVHECRRLFLFAAAREGVGHFACVNFWAIRIILLQGLQARQGFPGLPVE